MVAKISLMRGFGIFSSFDYVLSFLPEIIFTIRVLTDYIYFPTWPCHMHHMHTCVSSHNKVCHAGTLPFGWVWPAVISLPRAARIRFSDGFSFGKERRSPFATLRCDDLKGGPVPCPVFPECLNDLFSGRCPPVGRGGPVCGEAVRARGSPLPVGRVGLSPGRFSVRFFLYVRGFRGFFIKGFKVYIM